MKTKNYSVSMKAVLTIVAAFLFTAFVNAQSFQTPNPDAAVLQTPTEDVRTTNSIVYNLLGTHTAGEQYRWEVTGGTITGGTDVAGVSVIDFTADAHTITVLWDDVPASAIVAFSGQIQVQKISVNSCPSQVNTLPINIWNLPTANITDTDAEFCSGGATAGTITVELEGAPNATADGFRVEYEYVAPDVEDGLGAAQDGITGFVLSNTSSVTIPLPANLINTVATADRTFTVNLTLMQDDFDGLDGTWTDGSYVITVHPTLETGDIQSATSLLRR